MEIRQRKCGFLEWAKGKRQEEVLSHSNVDLPELHEVVNQMYRSNEFSKLLKENNQWGLVKLKKAIANRYGIENCEENPQVLLTPGASNAIYLVCKTFAKASGDEVIIEAPGYEPLSDAAKSVGARVVYWHRKGTRFSLDLESLHGLITKRTKLILLSNPHNPSSELTLDSELQQIVDVIRDNSKSSNIKIVVDEIYSDITKNDRDNAQKNLVESAKGRASSAVHLGNEFVSISSLSKVYGLSRIRCGWILGTPETIRELRETYKVVVNIGSLDIEAVSAAIFGKLSRYLRLAQDVTKANREVIRHEFMDMIENNILWGEIPEHGCTYFPKIVGLDKLSNTAADNVIDMLDKEFGVAPGSYFGGEYHSHIRIGLGGSSDKFYKAIRKLGKKLESLARGGFQ